MRFAPSALVFALGAQTSLGFRASRRQTECGVRGTVSSLEDDEPGLDGKIVNGVPAQKCDWRWQVGFMNSPGRTPWCGGMLIARNWVLTAAHCVEDGSTAFTVGAGLWNHSNQSTGTEQYSRPKRILMHPKYNTNTMNTDLALVELSTPFNLTACVGTICLPSKDLAGGEKVWITGWGTLYTNGPQPKILQQAQVGVLSNADCQKTSYKASEILPSMICASGLAAGGITDACQGDSGGPFVAANNGKWEIYGATSWGMGCAAKGYPGIWARVFPQVSWIKTQMAR